MLLSSCVLGASSTFGGGVGGQWRTVREVQRLRHFYMVHVVTSCESMYLRCASVCSFLFVKNYDGLLRGAGGPPWTWPPASGTWRRANCFWVTRRTPRCPMKPKRHQPLGREEGEKSGNLWKVKWLKNWLWDLDNIMMCVHGFGKNVLAKSLGLHEAKSNTMDHRWMPMVVCNHRHVLYHR